MVVPTSEVGYTPAMPRREDHEVHKGHVVALDKKNIKIVLSIYISPYIPNLLVCIFYTITDILLISQNKIKESNLFHTTMILLQCIHVACRKFMSNCLRQITNNHFWMFFFDFTLFISGILTVFSTRYEHFSWWKMKSQNCNRVVKYIVLFVVAGN